MSKILRVFRDGAARPIVAPYIKDGGEWQRASKIYRKEGGTWVEWWPLAPDAVIGLTGAFTYRNDRIELDIDFDAPGTGMAADRYRVQVTDLTSLDEPGDYMRDTDGPFTPDQAWQDRSGHLVVVSVIGVSPNGVNGLTAQTGIIVVPQLPAPPDPYDVGMVITNRRGVASWEHAGGNRLTRFELRTSYQGTTKDSVASDGDRSKDVTFWSTAATPGDPGGTVGLLIRAVGPGGSSNWVGSDGTVPNVPSPPPPPVKPPPPPVPPPVPPPEPPPPVSVPGTVKLTNHRFLNGILRCTYSAPNAASVKIWWERKGGGLVSVASQSGSSGTISIAASSGWARDEVNQYRIHVQGVNSAGSGGVTTPGPWCRKIPNPYVLVPSEFVSMRGAKPDEGLGALNLRQGASYNSYNYLSPIIIWRGYISYREEKFSAANLGYTPTISSAQIWMQRNTSGGSGSARSPRLWWHGYSRTNPTTPPGTSLFGGADLSPMARGAAAWQKISAPFARRLVDPNDPVKGVATYHEDQILRSYLGEVSESYIIMNGPFSKPFGQECFSMRLYHDG